MPLKLGVAVWSYVFSPTRVAARVTAASGAAGHRHSACVAPAMLSLPLFFLVLTAAVL